MREHLNNSKLIHIELHLKETHLGTAFSNHTSKMSSRVPSKSQIRGLMGAALGIPFLETQDLTFHYSYYWETPTSSQMVAMNRDVIKTKPNIRHEIMSDRERHNTIDYVEHLFNPHGPRLIGHLYLELPGEDAMRVVNAFKCPEYPLYLGKVENMVKIKDIEVVEHVEKKEGEAWFRDFFVGECDDFLITERLVDTMRDYRTPRTLQSVYSQHEVIRGTAYAGYYDLEERTICMW